jgi:3-hydroxyacyl-[acyl-carrier protein] dehydratase / trans-2-decenoyl-[acyl-carrier protein] isomerase
LDAPASPVSHLSQFSLAELLDCGWGKMFGPGNAQLPVPPMLMMHRINNITREGGVYGKGQVVAELDVSPDQWFFQCHFPGDPVMPGALGLDAMWQLVGFFLVWAGGPGKGRALGVGEVKFSGQVTPDVSKITYRIDMKKVIMRRRVLGVGDGVLEADGRPIYHASDLMVGLFSAAELQSPQEA